MDGVLVGEKAEPPQARVSMKQVACMPQGSKRALGWLSPGMQRLSPVVEAVENQADAFSSLLQI